MVDIQLLFLLYNRVKGVMIMTDIIATQREMLKNKLHEATQPYKELMTCYKCAMMEIETKFRVLNEQFSLQHERNPIESISSRLRPSFLFLTRSCLWITTEILSSP